MRERVRKRAEDRGSLDGMRKSFKTILDRQRENETRIPDFEARKERLRKTKETSVGNEQLLTQAIAILRENGFRVIVAKTAEAAMRKLKDEVQGYKLVVKSKSNVTKEMHLAEVLGKEGIEVIETDLGDRIIQLAGCAAAHPTGPACHMTRREISELFSRHFGKRVTDDPQELTKVMREEIANYISKARVGITGANAISALEGAVLIVHNEGNAAKCAMLPDKHIIVATPDKIVPDLDEAINVTKLQTYLSTGKIISSYVNVITGPSYTADIEKQVYKGMHGPKEVVIILVDDGRLEANDKEAQYCIGCGMCLLYCPTYNVVGPEFGSPGRMGGQGIYLEGSTGKLEGSVESGLFLCTSCGACTEVCPSRIDTKKGIISIRNAATKANKGISPEHKSLVSSLRNYDNPWQVPRRQKAKWADGLGLKSKGEVLFFAGCSTSLLNPENAKRAVRVLRALGVEPAYLGQAEHCCGSTARKIGEECLSREMVEANLKDFKAAGVKTVVTLCPGCASQLNMDADMTSKLGIRVQHITQFLAGRISPGSLSPLDGLGTVTYHDPCDLGRGLGVYDEPRQIMARMLSGPIVEMGRSRERSACCGSGSGVRSAFPELSGEIARDRVRMAKEAGADTIVTSCPWCQQSLIECQGTHPQTAVMDLLELWERASENRPKRRSSPGPRSH